MGRFCQNCGAPLPDDAKFCEECGAKVRPAEPAGGQYYAGRPAQSAPQAQGAPQAPSGPSGSGGGFPKAALIIGAVVLAAVIAVIAVFTGKKDKGGSAESSGVQSGTAAAGGASGAGNSGGGKAEGGLSGADQASLAQQGMDLINNGVRPGDEAAVKIPEGATVKEDAVLQDLIGEYEGEIQLTTIDGYENMPGLPASFAEEKKRMLSEPGDCELEIDEDGHWRIKFEIMGRSMAFGSRDFAHDEEFTPAEVQAAMIIGTTNGMYHAKIDKMSDTGGGTQGHVGMDHIGAYCTNGNDRMIPGNFKIQMQMNNADVVMQGDFLVHKTTEDYAKEEREALKGSSKAETSEAETSEAETSEAETSEAETSAAAETSGAAGQGGIDKEALRKKAEALTKKASKEAVTGGEWVQVASVWFYKKDGNLVKNSWIEDQGVYYYVDEDGYMLSEAYTPDGYYVGADGSYDPKAPQNQNAGNSEPQDPFTGEALASIAGKLSTDEPAYATEFDWFIDYVNHGGTGGGRVITDASRATRLTDLQAALNGGWKAFMFTEQGVYGSDGERYCNAKIDAEGGRFNITVNWKYFVTPSGTVEESGSDTFRGTYDDVEGTATAKADYARIDFDGFYLSTDGKTEYAVGTFYWISGERDRFALMRSAD